MLMLNPFPLLSNFPAYSTKKSENLINRFSSDTSQCPAWLERVGEVGWRSQTSGGGGVGTGEVDEVVHFLKRATADLIPTSWLLKRTTTIK